MALMVPAHLSTRKIIESAAVQQAEADLVIAGGGMGGCAAALAALRNRLTVIMTEETDWIGGQLSQQGVPPDEHRWIETHGSSALYRDFRRAIRKYYLDHYSLTTEVRNREFLNPGDGSVSRLCHEPKVAVKVLEAMFAPFESSRKLLLLKNHKIGSASVEGNRVTELEAISLQTGRKMKLSGNHFIDATELGDLLPLTGTEYITGTESKAQTGELHAPAEADPANNQAFTMCFAMDYSAGENHLIEKPADYAFWKNYVPAMQPPWPGKLLALHYSNPQTLQPKMLGFDPNGTALNGVLNLWNYRRIINRQNFEPGFYPGDITIVNWPQNDYFPGNLVDVPAAEFNRHLEAAKQLSLSLFYWLQTEAPRPDGGKGWLGLRLRNDVMGTEDGLAKYPYIREARRIKALFTVLEEHVGAEQRASLTGKSGAELKAAEFYDSVGIGYYHIDLHPSSRGNNYIDFGSLPFQIPLGALIPVRMENILPACKNIGTTHITNGCYRLHPVEWCIGEAVGSLVAFAEQHQVVPRKVHENRQLLHNFQEFIRKQGIETEWPKEV
jgi:hypothetical protein